MPAARSSGSRAPAPAGARPRPPRPFSFIEVLVAMSILVTLAGMLVPYSERVGEHTALADAADDLATIASSFSSAAAPAAAPAAARLRGAGELPADCPPEFSAPEALLDRLTLPSTLDLQERAALLLALQPDPWGCAYLVVLDEPERQPRHSMVVSAGPDRRLNTLDDLHRPID